MVSDWLYKLVAFLLGEIVMSSYYDESSKLQNKADADLRELNQISPTEFLKEIPPHFMQNMYGAQRGMGGNAKQALEGHNNNKPKYEHNMFVNAGADMLSMLPITLGAAAILPTAMMGDGINKRIARAAATRVLPFIMAKGKAENNGIDYGVDDGIAQLAKLAALGAIEVKFGSNNPIKLLRNYVPNVNDTLKTHASETQKNNNLAYYGGD